MVLKGSLGTEISSGDLAVELRDPCSAGPESPPQTSLGVEEKPWQLPGLSGMGSDASLGTLSHWFRHSFPPSRQPSQSP